MNSFSTYKGPKYIYEFWLDIFLTVHEMGGSVMISNAGYGSDKKLVKDVNNFHPDMVIELLNALERGGVIERFDLHHAFTLEKLPWERRWLEGENVPRNATIYAYGNKLGFHLWDEATVIVLLNEQANNFERQRFEELWMKAGGQIN